MVENKKLYAKILLLIMAILAIVGTQSLAATVARVTGLKSKVLNNSTVSISWNRVSNATGYEVYAKEPGKAYISLGKITSTSATINKLKAGTTYYVKVRAYNGNTYGTFSNEIKVSTTNSSTPAPSTLGKVSNLRLNNVTDTAANISWNTVTGATQYEVYVKAGSGAYQNLGKIANTNATISKLQPGTTYYVKIRACNGTKYGNFSDELRVVTNKSNTPAPSTLGKVSNLRLNNVTDTVANISWNTVTGATQYEVYVKAGSGAYQNLGKIANTNATISKLQPGTTYYVKIRACNGTKYGNFSDELIIVTTNSSTPAPSTLGKVLNLRLNRVTDTTANVSWSTVTGATQYEIYLRVGTGAYQNLGKIYNTNTAINTLQPGTTYYVKVRAYNGTKYGEFSDELKIVTTNSSTPAPTTLGKVSNLTSNNIKETTVDLNWNRVSNADGYEIYVNIPGRGYQSKGTTSNNYVTINGLLENTTYYAKVRAYKVENGRTIYGDFSDEISFTTIKKVVIPDIVLDKVTNVQVTITGTQANLTWNQVSNATGYEIVLNNRSLGRSNNNYTRIVGLSGGTTYTLKIRAYRTENGKTIYGDYSDDVTFTTDRDDVLGTVTNLKTTLASKSVSLNWDAVPTANGYEIYINVAGQGYRSLGTVGNKTNVRVVNLTEGTTYAVKVRAYKTLNGRNIYGDFSNEVTFVSK